MHGLNITSAGFFETDIDGDKMKNDNNRCDKLVGENIWVLMRKPKKQKYWNAFRFDTSVQSYVEDFMYSIYHYKDFFLCLEKDFAWGKYLMNGDFVVSYFYDRIIITFTKVNVRKKGKSIIFEVNKRAGNTSQSSLSLQTRR
jgi:hypothetical protein